MTEESNESFLDSSPSVQNDIASIQGNHHCSPPEKSDGICIEFCSLLGELPKAEGLLPLKVETSLKFIHDHVLNHDIQPKLPHQNPPQPNQPPIQPKAKF